MDQHDLLTIVSCRKYLFKVWHKNRAKVLLDEFKVSNKENKDIDLLLNFYNFE